MEAEGFFMTTRAARRTGDQRGIAKRFEVVLQSCLESAELAESLLTQFCEQAGCDQQERTEISLAVRESVINAVLHGNRRKLGKKVYLCAEIARSGLRVSVRDEGNGFNPRAVPDPRKPENLLRESGRGLLMMHALMDQVAIRRAASRGMEVRMVKFIGKRKPEQQKIGLKITTRRADGVAVLDLDGRIVLGEPAAKLRDTFQGIVARGEKKVLVNLAKVNYIDSSGLGALVSGFTTVASQQGEVRLANPTRKVQDLLRITKLLTVFEVYEDEASALESFR
jgi:anti-sigma B factor antagonist